MEFVINLPQPFNFIAAIKSHGWYLLEPNNWSEISQSLVRVEKLSSGKIARCSIKSLNNNQLIIKVQTNYHLDKADYNEINLRVVKMLRIDDDFSGFYEICLRKGSYWGQLTNGIGRLLCSPTIYEDIVKTICTTNTTWSRTILMVNKLTAEYGETSEFGEYTFPEPSTLGSIDPKELAQKTKLGYRAEYVVEFSRIYSQEKKRFDDLINIKNLSDALFNELLKIKGVGNYSACTIMMLLGNYSKLAIDSEMIKFVGEKYFNKNRPTIKEINRIYEDWGEWKYLAYWFDKPNKESPAANNYPGTHLMF